MAIRRMLDMYVQKQFITEMEEVSKLSKLVTAPQTSMLFLVAQRS